MAKSASVWQEEGLRPVKQPGLVWSLESGVWSPESKVIINLTLDSKLSTSDSLFI